jgi:hypothetical protein
MSANHGYDDCALYVTAAVPIMHDGYTFAAVRRWRRSDFSVYS